MHFKMSALWLVLIAISLPRPGLGRTPSSPLLTPQGASEFLMRVRRANQLFEEVKKGNLERECVEELCSKEEAREVFENESETEYFYPRYSACQSQQPKPGAKADFTNVIRSCIDDIFNQCAGSPCDAAGSTECLTLQADYHCVCKDGWKGKNCTQDVDECSDRDNGDCSHKCINLLGSYVCQCERGYTMNADQRTCTDVDECAPLPGVCGELAGCNNTPGSFTCSCLRGFAYDKATQTCKDVDECELYAPCEDACVNTLGAFRCYCEGRAGVRLAPNLRSCVATAPCVRINSWVNPTNMHLSSDSASSPVFFDRYTVPNTQREVFSFDLMTYDPEGLILYVERAPAGDWFLLALRAGRLEMQLSARGAAAAATVASSSVTINHGRWTSISVERAQGRIVTRISTNETISMAQDEAPASAHGSKEIKVYVAGLPRGAQPALWLNVRLDACMRQWEWLEQRELVGVRRGGGGGGGGGAAAAPPSDGGAYICSQNVERGAHFPGSELARFHHQYVPVGQSPSHVPWLLDLEMSFRALGDTGVLFCLVNYNKEVVLSLSLELLFRKPASPLQSLVLGFEDSAALRYQPDDFKVFCDGEWHHLRLQISREELALRVDRGNLTQADSIISQEKLSAHRLKLETWLNESVATYIGGIPETVPLQAVPVSAFFHGCVRDVRLGGEALDMDATENSPLSLSTHSCPTAGLSDDDDDDDLE